MYLKQLTLRGFKSFASATTLTFEPGITCVVGPNGSGKSNVVDALSWVMGEQGAKSLRGGKMEDVIFAGTAKRAPLGRAEVELTIDNSDGALPIEYSEVTLTRTMFRSGGSEYAINGSPARLLDVQELLSDSGIGREMHVIVGQGQLDQILQATPESRRGFIEEAAGVLKHRKRKERALRKLEGTQGNLDRLQDLISELQRQLKPLGRQAETARKAAVIQAELRDAKARLLADDLAAALHALETELADEQSAALARDRAERAVRDANVAEEAAEAASKQAACTYDEAQERWYALASLKERISTTVSVSAERMRMADNQPQLDVGGRDPEELEKEAAEVRQREAELLAQVEQAHQKLTDATLHRNAVEKQHATAEQEYAAALRAIADRREGLARLTGQVNSMASRVEASDEEIERLERRLAETVERAAEAERSYHATESSLAGLGDAESNLDAEYEAATVEVERIEQRIAELRDNETQLTRQRSAVQAKIEALRLATERKDGSQELLASEHATARLSDLIKVADGWENAVAVALQAVAEAVVAGSLVGAVDAVNYLAEHDKGSAAVVVSGAPTVQVHSSSLIHKIQAPKNVIPALSHVLGTVVAVESVSEARRIVAAEPTLSAVTRAGDLISTWLVIGGASNAPSLLELTAELDRAEAEETELGHALDRLRFCLKDVLERAESTKARERDALAALHNSDAQLAAVADQLSQAKQTQGAAKREAQRLREAIEAATSAREVNQRNLEALQQRLDNAATDEVGEPDPTERDELAVKARLARQSEMEARLKLRTVEEQAKALAGRADGLMRAAHNERASRAKAQARLAHLKREAQVAAAVHDAAQHVSALVDEARVRATAERDAADQERREAEAAVTSARHATRSATAHLDEIVTAAHRDEMTRIEHKMRIEQLTERALSELGMEPEPLIAEYGPSTPVPVITRPDGTALHEDDEVPEPIPYVREEQAKRLRRAERNLQVLGKINPLALEEFDAMKARHAFLAEQLDDLKRTRADLMDIVEQVDQRVREVFEAAYTDVAATFEQVFSRLFPGGEGRLVLTEPGQWLTTGVDVEARPAGKQIKRLSLLSGGERSLVAVAFLVSLFIARPSPFYILDEVEAALDDQNLGRLLSIYEELRQNSQLLIITHQKRTMEVADSLYGVTMRGDGISTVISQRLQSQ